MAKKQVPVAEDMPVRERVFLTPFDGWSATEQQTKPFDIRKLVERVLQKIWESNTGLSFSNIVHPDVPVFVEGQPRLLKLVLTNLLLSSVKGAADGCLSLEVYLAEETQIQFRFKSVVSSGLEADSMEEVRGKFVELAINKIGGSIERSVTDSGTTVALSLPLVKSKKVVSLSERADLEKKRAIVVSKSPERLRELAKQLKLRGLMPTPVQIKEGIEPTLEGVKGEFLLFDLYSLSAEEAARARKNFEKVLSKSSMRVSLVAPRPNKDALAELKKLQAHVLEGPIFQSKLYSLLAEMAQSEAHEKKKNKVSGKKKEQIALKTGTDDSVELPEISDEDLKQPLGFFSRFWSKKEETPEEM